MEIPQRGTELFPARQAYARATCRFLRWAEEHLELRQATPVHVAAYTETHPGGARARTQARRAEGQDTRAQGRRCPQVARQHGDGDPQGAARPCPDRDDPLHLRARRGRQPCVRATTTTSGDDCESDCSRRAASTTKRKRTTPCRPTLTPKSGRQSLRSRALLCSIASLGVGRNSAGARSRREM